MAKTSDKVPATTAVRVLRADGVAFIPHFYRYADRGGTRHAAKCLGIAEHRVLKTLVLEATGMDGKRQPLILIMHGDREASTKALAREIGVKAVEPATAVNVERHTGYVPGGVSPFGTRTVLPVYVEATIFDLETVLINGGKRGFLVEMPASELRRVLRPREVRVGLGCET